MITKITYFWIAEYNNKTALPQFDPQTGKENLFKEIDQSKLIRFGLHPFNTELGKIVKNAIVNKFLPKFVINLSSEDKLFFRRRNYIEMRGHYENRYVEYLLGTQHYILHIDEFGNTEIRRNI